MKQISRKGQRMNDITLDWETADSITKLVLKDQLNMLNDSIQSLLLLPELEKYQRNDLQHQIATRHHMIAICEYFGC